MAGQANLKNIAIWGGANENKSRAPVRWKHDYILFASYVDKLIALKDPSILIPFIFDKELDEIKSKELYDGVFEYKDKDITVELVEGLEYTEYKIFGKMVDFDAITQRLLAAGAQMRKPEIPIEIPDRPPLVDVEQLNKQRYSYHEETLDKDKSVARNMRIKAAFKSVFGVAAFAVILTYLAMEIFVPKYEDVTPPPDDSIFITAKGYNVVYSIGKLKIFTAFKFADLIDGTEEISYDTTYKMYVLERKEIGKNEIIVDKMEDSEGKVVYNVGNRIVDTGRDPTDYEYINAAPFEYNSYMEAGDADWNRLGSLDEGNAKKVIFRGRIIEREGKFIALLGSTYAELGTVSEVDSIPQFYELLEDDISYATILYSLKAEKTIDFYGRINKTLTSREGRNVLLKRIFTFEVDYARRVK